MAQTSAAFRRNMRGFDGCISLSEIISALSYALDLTEGAVHGHALRSCLLGMRIAEEVKLPSDQTSSLYFALLLKDIGCSRSASRMSQILAGDDRAARAAVNFEDWSRPHKPSLSTLKLLWSQVLPDAGRVVRAARSFKNGITRYQSFERLSPRYDRGASILNELGMGPIAAEAVRSVDERWDGSGYPDSLKGEQIPLLARICAIAQHLDLVSAAAGAQSAIDTLEERSGTWFDPQLVRIAGSLHRRGALWNNCSPRMQSRIRGRLFSTSTRASGTSWSPARSIGSARRLRMWWMRSLTSPFDTRKGLPMRRSALRRRWDLRQTAHSWFAERPCCMTSANWASPMRFSTKRAS
ncbi:HD domain-containing phosphohydrolase [Tunturiibacter empetritectus]